MTRILGLCVLLVVLVGCVPVGKYEIPNQYDLEEDCYEDDSCGVPTESSGGSVSSVRVPERNF